MRKKRNRKHHLPEMGRVRTSKGRKQNDKSSQAKDALPWLSVMRKRLGRKDISSSCKLELFKGCTPLRNSPISIPITPRKTFHTYPAWRRQLCVPQNVAHKPCIEMLAGQVKRAESRDCQRGLVYGFSLDSTVLSQATWALATPNTAKTSLLGVHGWLAEPIGKESKMFFHSRFEAHQG